MITTIIVVVLTHDLTKGVFAKVLMSPLFLAKKVSRLLVVKSDRDEHGQRVYTVQRQVLFCISGTLCHIFRFKEVLENVTIDVHKAYFGDLSAVWALDKAVLKFKTGRHRREIA